MSMCIPVVHICMCMCLNVTQRMKKMETIACILNSCRYKQHCCLVQSGVNIMLVVGLGMASMLPVSIAFLAIAVDAMWLSGVNSEYSLKLMTSRLCLVDGLFRVKEQPLQYITF